MNQSRITPARHTAVRLQKIRQATCAALVLLPLTGGAWERTVILRSEGQGNRADIDQSASGGGSLIQIDQVADSLNLNQAGTPGSPIRQTGEAHTLVLSQDARGGVGSNDFTADQSGIGMSITAHQGGGGDQAQVLQKGEAANSLQLQQSGNDVLSSAVQDSGSDGKGLGANIRQSGGGRISALSQTGNNNLLDIQQDKTGAGGELMLDVSQSGLGNRLNVTQQTTEGSASITQSGRNNQLNFSQDQPMTGITVSQTGTGANVSISNPVP